MSNPEVAILMLVSFIFLVLLGFPVAFTLIGMGLAFGFYYYTTQGDTIVEFTDISQIASTTCLLTAPLR